MIEPLLDVLDLSVVAERRLREAGVVTVADLRARLVDPVAMKAMKLGAKFHREAIAKALAAWDVKARADRIAAARAAMLALTAEERSRIHAEVGCCACAEAGSVLAKNPDVAIGAFVGGILARIMRAATPKAAEKEKPKIPSIDPSLLR